MTGEEFSARVMENEKLLYHVAYLALGRAQDCPDAVQEAILRAWKCRKQLRSMAQFKSWITRIVFTVCMDMKRNSPPIPALINDTPVDPPDNLPLHDAIMRLPPDTRLAIVLYYLEGMKIEDIAKAQGTTQGTVKSRLHRGRLALKDFLQEEE